MKQGFFSTIFYTPLYNAMILLIALIPGQNAGLAVILLTILIRVILYPLSKKSIKTQLLMKKIQPEADRIKKEVKDKQEQAKQTLELYKKNDVNPFAGFFLILIQLPILIALYQVFQSGFPVINTDYLYSFVHAPTSVSMSFLGVNLLTKNYFLAIIAVVTQFIQINLSLPKSKKPEGGSLQTDIAHSMNMQMRYIFPLIMFPIALVSSVLALYLITSNIFMTLQELYIKKKLAHLKS